MSTQFALWLVALHVVVDFLVILLVQDGAPPEDKAPAGWNDVISVFSDQVRNWTHQYSEETASWAARVRRLMRRCGIAG